MNESFHKWLDERIEEAEKEAKEASKTNMNSYGAGNMWGIVEGLKEVKNYFSGE